MSDHKVHNTLSILCHSILVAGLGSAPGATGRYIYLGLVSALLVYHVAQSQTPVAKINVLTAAIASANQLVRRAPSTTARDQVMSMDQQLLLRIAEKSKSQLQCQLLEIEGHAWKEYLRDVRSLLQSIDECTKDVKRIQSKLQLMIEQDTQRKLDDDIQKSREMLAAIHFGPRRVCLCVIERSTLLLTKSIRLCAPAALNIEFSFASVLTAKYVVRHTKQQSPLRPESTGSPQKALLLGAVAIKLSSQLTFESHQ
ncbi:hypothetical protein GGX14DRAFT_587118 [Mycena pura]|uniref:Uncharacterized protein n=1 Tax=Mycena pura TaxID=153505 RepID=A0AAD6UWY8_9AGAR|nr:hypothetical protein GGX14DRAFT_587118 [Mycena pura]